MTVLRRLIKLPNGNWEFAQKAKHTAKADHWGFHLKEDRHSALKRASKLRKQGWLAHIISLKYDGVPVSWYVVKRKRKELIIGKEQ